jgi:hypothetical protein
LSSVGEAEAVSSGLRGSIGDAQELLVLDACRGDGNYHRRDEQAKDDVPEGQHQQLAGLITLRLNASLTPKPTSSFHLNLPAI